MFLKMLKNVGDLTLGQAGDYVAGMGFEGADLTVREGGYVLPEEVTKRLPEAIEILESKGLSVPMITTNVAEANKGYADEIFKAASEGGVEFIKLGYWRYEGFGKIKEQIEKARDILKGIYGLSKEYGVTAAIHIHSGDCLSANPAVLWMLLQGYDPEYLGAYIDPGHMAVEGGKSGWRMGMDLLQEHIRMVAVKNFGWFQERDEKTGKKIWKVHTVPLIDGLVPWPEVFMYLRQISFDGPVSIHSEYHMNFQDLIRQTKEDLKYLKDILEKIR